MHFFCGAFQNERRERQETVAELEGGKNGHWSLHNFRPLTSPESVFGKPFIFFAMVQLRALSARKAAATSSMYGRLSLRATARMAGAAKARKLSAKALMAPNSDARFPPSTMASSSSPLSSQDAAPRVRVFEKLASTVAINVSQRSGTIRERDRGAEALAGKRRGRDGESKDISARRGTRSKHRQKADATLLSPPFFFSLSLSLSLSTPKKNTGRRRPFRKPRRPRSHDLLPSRRGNGGRRPPAVRVGRGSSFRLLGSRRSHLCRRLAAALHRRPRPRRPR